jgi:XTP/dITP diphosphohydrolase
MATRRTLVLGTRNRKKLAELAALLEPHGLQLKTLDDFPQSVDVVEDGQTFAENAAKKAVQQAELLQHWVLGEDSGLVVDALDGQPGIRSARFSGPAATDDTNNASLLERLAEVPLERRAAHYVCHMTLADPRGEVRADCEAICRGRIRREPAGTGGFGYDPLFEVLEYRQTFGELGSHVKAMLSHRGRAVRQMVRKLVHLIRTGAWATDASAKEKAGRR